MSFKNHLALLASAGSGKTFALSIRYVSLLLLGESPGVILAATFTKKAAREMYERVLKFLYSLDDKDILAAVVEQSGLESKEVLKRQQGAIDRFLKESNYIVTIDSFINSILKSSSLHIDLEPNYRVKDGIYNDIDLELITELERNSKLLSLVKLSLNLNKRRSADVVGLFEFLYNLDATLPELDYELVNLEPIESEIEALRVETLEAIKNSGASASAVKIFEESNFREFIKKGVFEKESLYEHRFFKKYLDDAPIIESNFNTLKELIGKYHNALEQNILYYLFDIYNRYKVIRLDRARATGVLDFNDILYLTFRLLSHHITKDFLYFKLDSKFKHILLDEFQDTSSLQFLILKPLIDEIFAGKGVSDFRSFFYVGDTKQSLYRFRGGVEELFEYVSKNWGVEIEHLDRNYRSSKGVVEAVNGWFINKIDGYKKQIAVSSKSGYVEVCESEDIANKAIDRVKFLLESGVALEDIAFLVFANKDAITLQEALKLEGIESILKTSSSLKSNPKIAALVGVLEYIVSIGEEIVDSDGQKLGFKRERVYIEPFLQKIGQEYKSFKLSDFKASDLPFKVLKTLIDEYKYFDKDLNVLKLLDFSKEFSSIYEFLDEFKTSNIYLANNSTKGVNIMTIHGSKGLEFDYVICLDRFGKGAPNRDLLLFKSANPIEIEKIFYKSSKKDNFVNEYKEALDLEKDLAIKDKLNLLYVALTRASNGLIVIKKEKSSEFSLIDLEPSKSGEIEIKKRELEKEAPKLNSKISSYGMQELNTEEKEQSIKEYGAIYFGEALHYILELADFSNSNSLDSAYSATVNRYGEILSQEELQKIKNRAKNLFDNSEFLKLISGATLSKEQPLVFEDSFYQIDLLAKFEDKNIVFDYKSSRKFSTKHITQVQGYAESMQTIDKKPCTGYIVYLLDSGVELEKVG